MSSNYISKILIFGLIIFINSCQDRVISFNDNENSEILENKTKFEELSKIDLTSETIVYDDAIDFYSNEEINYNFLDKDLKKIKIKNYGAKYNNTIPINIIYNDLNFYSVSSKGKLLKFDEITGKIIDSYEIKHEVIDKTPTSFSLVSNDFIIGYRSGEIIRVDKEGNVKWSFFKDTLLNTPIKYYDKNLVILYPEDIVILSSINGEIIFEKKYRSSNIIQSSGGKIVNFFNLLFFLLPNSELNVIDTFLFEENLSKLDDLDIKNKLNNLDDKIHIYKNYFVYLDNLKFLNTYDITKDEFLLSNYKISSFQSSLLFNNALISKNDTNIYMYNIKNGKIFSNINIDKVLKKGSKIIKAIMVDNKLHLFSNDGYLIILDENNTIIDAVNLKIKNINLIYNYQGKLFISTNNGITHIF